jgi:hypothetical protein
MASSASMEQCTTSRQYNILSFLLCLISSRCVLTLNRRQAELLCNLGVLDPRRILQRHTTNQLGQVTRASNCASAAEGLKLHVADGVVVGVDSDLKLHDVAACRCADKSSADVVIGLGHGTNISWAIVVVEQCCEC